MARLVIFDESVRGIDLPRHPVILGRSMKADIPIHDHLLSRKHCTIMPVGLSQGSGQKFGAALRLIDLKSSNGTFLNGSRIERSDLQFDDIIEIGNTVMVLLDTDTWKRGEGLTRLRNPVKAQELIQKIKMRAVQEKNGSKDPPEIPGSNIPGSNSAEGAMARGASPGSASQEAGGSLLGRAGRSLLGRGQGRRSASHSRKVSSRQRRTLTPSEAAFFEWAGREWLARPLSKDLLKDYVAHQVISLMVRHSPQLKDIVSLVMERVLVPENFEGGLEKLEAAIQGALRDRLANPLTGAPRPDPDSGGELPGKQEEGPPGAPSKEHPENHPSS